MVEKEEKMNKKGQAKIIMAIWWIIAALIILVLLTLIDPLSTVFDGVIGADGLNCSNPTEGYRGSCIAVRGGILFFVGGLIYYVISGLINKSRGGVQR